MLRRFMGAGKRSFDSLTEREVQALASSSEELAFDEIATTAI